MVHGLSTFREYFKGFKDQYVLIGGSACSLWFDSEGIQFRTTKDLDVVLVIESLDQDFAKTFIDFVEKGRYEHISKGKTQFYRFAKPKDSAFPQMVELFSRKPEFLKGVETRLAPIHISDETESLSAILLDDDYYNVLKNNSVVTSEISLLNVACLVVFKIKAYMDLMEKEQKGNPVDSRDIKKHRNDVLRLAGIHKTRSPGFSAFRCVQGF